MMTYEELFALKYKLADIFYRKGLHPETFMAYARAEERICLSGAKLVHTEFKNIDNKVIEYRTYQFPKPMYNDFGVPVDAITILACKDIDKDPVASKL
ncbi:MAG: hypothetical protein PWP65_934 [Clostridia bacterium]|nr:hypothetical protein [Clostridia bacterium]